MTAPVTTVTEVAGCYVVTFPNGETSSWQASREFYFTPDAVWQMRRNADALAAIVAYRAGQL